jgi:hypothetical protein
MWILAIGVQKVPKVLLNPFRFAFSSLLGGGAAFSSEIIFADKLIQEC